MKRALLVSLAAGSLLIGGVVTAAQAADEPAGSTVKASAPVDVADARTDGKALFTGLYFGQGTVGKKLLASDAFIGDRTGQLKKNGTPEARQAIKELTAAIDEAAGRTNGVRRARRTGKSDYR
ncbi:hypothetical protein ACIQ6Y_01405 [Streptomyces sp. NPDC096205]|uniref:hypothetical protein n=1 Tax=Streptomyces sp. NPDC096205 TaxID=3366081 RepID=UPI0037FF4BF5